jgi:large subunit ribosomal protein L21
LVHFGHDLSWQFYFAVQPVGSIFVGALQARPVRLESNMFAIVESSGRQYQLEAGKFVDIDSTAVEAGTEFVFDRVLMLVDGKQSTVGAPLVEGAKVVGKVLEHGREAKIIVYHQKPKKGTRKKQGHRQGYTRVLVESILLKDEVLAKAEPRAKAEPKKKTVAPKTEAAPAPKKEPKAAAPKAAAKAPAKAPAKPAEKKSEPKAEKAEKKAEKEPTE